MYVTDGSVSISDRYRRSASCIACSAALRSPTSTRKPWLNRGRPSSSRTIEAWSRNHHSVPQTFAVRAGDHHRVVVQPGDGAVGPDDPVLDVERIARLVRSLRLHEDALAVVGMQHADP